jgi:hypothetical protein
MPVTDKGSRLFSEQLIENVLKGMSYGKATMEARKKFHRDLSGGTDWMRFVYYGNPMECLETVAPVISFPGKPPGGSGITSQAAPEDARAKTYTEHKKNTVAENIVKENQRRKEKASIRRKIPFFLLAICVVSTALFFLFRDGLRETSAPAGITAEEAQTSPPSASPDPQTPPDLIADALQTPEDASVPAEAAAVQPKPKPTPPPAASPVKPKADVLPPSAAASVSDFYGSWKSGTGIVMEISKNELTRSLDGITFRMNITGVEPVSNSNSATGTGYPSGIRFTGTVIEKGWWIDSPETGAAHSYTLFLHAGRNSFSQNGLPGNGNVYTR